MFSGTVIPFIPMYNVPSSLRSGNSLYLFVIFSSNQKIDMKELVFCVILQISIPTHIIEVKRFEGKAYMAR